MAVLNQRDRGEGVTPARMLRFFGLWVQKKTYDTNTPNSEEIWLAAFKLKFENHELERARMLLAKARDRGGTESVWMKSAIVERELANYVEERRLLDKELKRFPLFFKLWLKPGRLEEILGCNHCPNCISFWHSLGNLEEKSNGLRKARALSKNPLSHENWLVTIRVESKHGNKKEADSYITKALQKDFWALYYKFELQHGNFENQKEVLKKCIVADLKHEEKWQAISQAVENSH
ncbi:hypothetical protein CUMW_200460 [Citrus unshiu]|uniref:Suppressor of forked domain-containing protein n=1 Tax=Citrus unshiu TaxID=55188 RepID=A0A2H5Q6K5_CITUN|nr:hypothetical protein CUMW_200460 [Citrus unshiu]